MNTLIDAAAVTDAVPPRAEPIDLSIPQAYRQQVDLARMIAKFICAMQLEKMAWMSRDVTNLALLSPIENMPLARMRRDRDTIDVLASAQRQLAEIRARYGE